MEGDPNANEKGKVGSALPPNLPPQREEIRNLADLEPGLFEGWEVAEWHPLPDGQGKPEQVCLVLSWSGGQSMVLRLKTANACDMLIAALQRHRENVWGRR